MPIGIPRMESPWRLRGSKGRIKADAAHPLLTSYGGPRR